MFLNLLGAARLTYQGEALEVQKKNLALICYLALQNRPCPRDDLTELLWGAGRSGSLRTALYKLRQLPDAEMWLLDGDRVEVCVQSDVGLLRRDRDAPNLSDEALACLDLYLKEGQGLLFGFKAPTPAYGEWMEEERQRVTLLLDDLMERAAHEALEAGKLERAQTYAEALIARNPLDEPAYRLLMQLEHDRGYPEHAQRTFERLSAALEEVGGPSRETLELHRQLLGTSSGAQGRLLNPGDEVPARAPHLIGRRDLLEKLNELVHECPVLLHGFGGVGKTALAAEFASDWLAARAQNGETDDEARTVLWLQAGLSSAAELVSAVGQALGLASAAPAAFSQALTRALGRVSLVVVDDAWNEGAVAALRQHLPASLPLIVTARQRVGDLERLDVGRLARADARRLLALEAGLDALVLDLSEAESDNISSNNPSDDVSDDASATPSSPTSSTPRIKVLNRVCDLLGGHPFALRLAGAKLKHDQLAPAQLLAQLADAPHALKTPKSWREAGRESVSALLQASLDALSDDAYDAFFTVGALTSSTVTAALLARSLRRDAEVAEAALIELQTRALATRTANPGSDVVRYTLHDLSHSFARQNTTLRPQTVLRACQSLVHADPKDFETLDAEIANVMGALGAAQERGDQRTLLRVMADLVIGDAYFSARGHTPRSLKLLEVAVGWAKESGELMWAHHFVTKLGDAYRVQYHEFEKALRAYSEGARLAQLVGDKAREAILTSLCGIAQHHLKRSPEEAFRRAYQLAQEVNDLDAIGQVLQHRGFVAGFYNNWKLVASLNKEALKVSHSFSNTSGADRARADDLLYFSLLNLGEAKRKLGNFGEAITIRQEALNIATKCKNQMWQAYALHELGEMYLEAHQAKKAETYLKEALNLYKVNHAVAEVEQVQKLLIDENSRRVDA